MKTKLTLFILSVLLISSCAVKPATRYAKTHKQNNYSYVMKNSESFTVGSLKNDVSTLKGKIRELKKGNNNHEKIDQLEATLADLRAQIKELEKQ